MSQPTTCPDVARLKGLLDRTLSEEDQAFLIAHLDDCETCQQSLEVLADGNNPLPAAVAQVGQTRPPDSSAFWPALSKLEAELTTHIIRTPITMSANGNGTALLPGILKPPAAPGYVGRIGRFDVIGVIGHGGMGVVLKAYDAYLQRPVALKVLEPAMAHQPLARQRFCREARAAAAISHESVVTIHDVEHEEGSDLPYLVMQLVVGESLQDRLDRGERLDLETILQIGAQTASALAAAHARGLTHRDVKPANILLEEGSGHVKLSDFGLARTPEDVKLTQSGYIAGTPLYMAPEQARGEAVDYRADLFSLGSVLYTMCTRRPPFDGGTPFVVLKNVTEARPCPIRDVNPEIPDWLCELIDQLLAKDPAARAQSATTVAQLLQRELARLRFVVDEKRPPARRTSSRRRGRSWLAAAAILVLLLAGFAVAERSGATRFLKLLESKEVITRPISELDAGTGPVWSVSFTPDGQTLALGLDNGTVQIWDRKEGKLLKKFNAHHGAVWSLAFSPDGHTLATGGSDRKLKLWDPSGWSERVVLENPTGALRTLAFGPDGRHVVTGDRDGCVVVWDLENRMPHRMNGIHEGGVIAVAFSADGSKVASGGNDEIVRLWEVASGHDLLTLRGHHGSIYAVAFSPDGTLLASAGWDHTIQLWDVETGIERMQMTGHPDDIWSLAFSPDGKRLASGGEDRTVRLWDVATGRELAHFRKHTGALHTVVFTPDGQVVASSGRDGVVRLWDVETAH